MQLLSTNFKRVDGKFVWIGHNVLATKIIENGKHISLFTIQLLAEPLVRRSGPTSESFSFEVAFDTTFEALQSLRGRMLIFVKENGRDYLPIFDVIVDDIPGQGKMVLKADIKYKSNWQQGALKVQRRNKWICALKMT
jgi:small-conductance mechanosensitive channel